MSGLMLHEMTRYELETALADAQNSVGALRGALLAARKELDFVKDGSLHGVPLNVCALVLEAIETADAALAATA